MALTLANICSSLRTMPIIDDNFITMCPSDMIGWDNSGTKGVPLPVSWENELDRNTKP